MSTFANAPAPRSALFDDAPALALPDHLAAEGWTLHQSHDLRTADQREQDDVAELRAEIARLTDLVNSMEETMHRQGNDLTALMLERDLERRV